MANSKVLLLRNRLLPVLLLTLEMLLPVQMRAQDSGLSDGDLFTAESVEGVTRFGNRAFGYCNDLAEVAIPSTVTVSEYNDFMGSDNQKRLMSYIQQPFALEGDVFDGVQYEEATLYVPQGTKALYQATEGWSQFRNIRERGASDAPSRMPC